jgi:hypothetical protein
MHFSALIPKYLALQHTRQKPFGEWNIKKFSLKKYI